MEDSTIRAVLAISSDAGRAAMRALLHRQLGIWQIEEVSDPDAAAEQVSNFEPHLLLFDDRMLAYTSVRTMLGTMSSQRPHHMVLVSVRSGALDDSALQYVVAVEYLDAPCDAIIHALRAHLDEPARAQRSLALVPRDTMVRHFAAPAILQCPPYSGTWLAERSPVRVSSKNGDARHPSPAARQLVALLHTLLDLPTPPWHGQKVQWETPLFAEALRVLPQANAPATILVLELWPRFAPSQVASQAPSGLLLQAIRAGLQDVVRRDDLLCRLASSTFAILMPGVSAHYSAGPQRRIWAVLELLRGKEGAHSSPAIGTGFWEPGMAPIAPFEQGWQAMLATANQDRYKGG